jgi:RNA polymerase sigma factor (sigma-70 family)
MVMCDVSNATRTRVSDPQLRREVEAAVRRRVRGDDAEDVVQATLADVLSAAQVPEEPEEFRRFVFGVARNKVFDHFRRQRRRTAEGLEESHAAAPEPPLSARDILRWAEGELPDPEARSTFEWMLREGEGEKLEHIARDARMPAARVRKRVSRLRKRLRERWAAELMLLGFLLVLGGLGALYWYARGRQPDDFVRREPPRPLPSAPRSSPLQRPAGSAAPIPNLAAPDEAPPAPSSSSTPAPRRAPPTKLSPTASPLSTEFPQKARAAKAAKPPAPVHDQKTESWGTGDAKPGDFDLAEKK